MVNKQAKQKIAGFSLPEMIVVMACLAVIVGLSTGDMTRVFARQIAEQERIDLQNIKKAMAVYSLREGSLPTDTTDCDPNDTTAGRWHVELAKYSTMTPAKICIDEYEKPRVYKVERENKTFRTGGFRYEVQYASVASYGRDSVENNAGWSGIHGLDGFVNYQAAGDDQIVKYHNAEEKLDRYEETLNRIDTIEVYLERYIRAKRAYAISLEIDEFDNAIMVPKDGRSLDNGNYFDTDNAILTANANFSSDIEVETLTTAMSAVELTTILGLPEYFGRSALDNAPLWYISNPGPDRNAPCDNARSEAPYYPPAIILTTTGNPPTGCV